MKNRKSDNYFDRFGSSSVKVTERSCKIHFRGYSIVHFFGFRTTLIVPLRKITRLPQHVILFHNTRNTKPVKVITL